MKFGIGGFQSMRVVAPAIISFLTFSGCPTQIITLVIPGDFTRFSDTRVQISISGGPLLDHQGEFTADGATVQYSGSTGGQILLVLTLETAAAQDGFGQVVKETQVGEGNVPVTGAQVQVNGIDDDGPLEWTGRYHVSNRGVTAVFPYDPCEVFAALVVDDGGEACEVDSDRALYADADAGGNLLASIFAQDPTLCSYDGGNILSHVGEQDLDAFADVCKADTWQSADAATCHTRDNSIECLIFVWNKPAAED